VNVRVHANDRDPQIDVVARIERQIEVTMDRGEFVIGIDHHFSRMRKAGMVWRLALFNTEEGFKWAVLAQPESGTMRRIVPFSLASSIATGHGWLLVSGPPQFPFCRWTEFL
jgi:hypothetical protein